jgi:hypothetical protein
MTSALKGFHYGHSQKNILRQLIGHTVVIGVVAPLLAAAALSRTLSSTPADATHFQDWKPKT